MTTENEPRTIGEILQGLGLCNGKEGALSREQVFVVLERAGVSEAQLDFSGGNDEGGVNEVRFVRGESEVELISAYGEYDEQAGRWRRSDGYPQELIDGLGEPVYSQYGSFAGDFYVQGTVTWKVAERSVVQEGSEEIPRSESIAREL